MRKEIKNISLASVFSALLAAFVILAGAFELLDLCCAAICSVIMYVSMIEIKGKYPFLIYITTSVLSLIFVPMTTSCLYYIAFFGFYPIIRHKFKKIGKTLSKLVCLCLFNITMVLLYLLFRTVFAINNEPAIMYVILLITANVFFVCFDYALDVFAFLYIVKIRPRLRLK